MRLKPALEVSRINTRYVTEFLRNVLEQENGFFAPCAVGGSKGQAGFRLWLSLLCPWAVTVSLWLSQPCSGGANSLVLSGANSTGGHKEWAKHLNLLRSVIAVTAKGANLHGWGRSGACSTSSTSRLLLPGSCTPALGWAAAPAARLLSRHLLVGMSALLRGFSVNDVLWQSLARVLYLIWGNSWIFLPAVQEWLSVTCVVKSEFWNMSFQD